MRDISNCLNAPLTLICLPLYLQAMFAGVLGFVLGYLAPHWLPLWARSISPTTFLWVALTLMGWYFIIEIIQSTRMSGLQDFTGMEILFYTLDSPEEGLFGYLLAVCLLIAFVVFRPLMR